MKTIIKPKTLKGKIKAPSSKSETQRALFIAFNFKQEIKIINPNLCQDVQETIKVLKDLGAIITIKKDYLIIKGPASIKKVDHLYVDFSGTTLRFLIPLLLINNLKPIIHLSVTLNDRIIEQDFLDLGIKIEKHNQILKIIDFKLVETYHLKVNNSSQLISGLMIAIATNNLNTKINIERPVDPYLLLTNEMLKRFGIKIYELESQNEIEYDYQSVKINKKIKIYGDYSIAANLLSLGLNGYIKVTNLPLNSSQGDSKFIEILKSVNADTKIGKCQITVKKSNLKPLDIDLKTIPDLGPILMAIALTIKDKSHFYHLKRLMYKETNRIKDVVKILTLFGAQIEMGDDELWITGPNELKEPAAVSSYFDHRIVFMLIFISTYLKEPLTILNSEVYQKSYPELFVDIEKLKGDFINA